MRNFSFYSKNNATSDSIIVSSGTATVANLYDNDLSTEWAAAATSATISFNYDNYSPSDGRLTATTLTLRGMNWKAFTISDGVTTSVSIVEGPTTSANFVSNSETSMFLELDPTNFNSAWTITVSDTIDGEVVSCDDLSFLAEICELELNPSSGEYLPIRKRISIEHVMQDGGLIVYELGFKFNGEFSAFNIQQDNRNELLEVFEYQGNFTFIPFGSDDWDQEQYLCYWVNGFEFYTPTDNVIENGYSGVINLEESS